MQFSRPLLVVVFCLSSVSARVAVAGQSAQAATTPVARASRAAPVLRSAASPISASRLALPPPGARSLQSSKNGPLVLGFGRDVPAAARLGLQTQRLSWTPVDGGQAASFAVTSVSAAAIRVALAIEAVPPALEVRFFDRVGRVQGPFDGATIAEQLAADDSTDAVYWSPVLEGATAGVELYVPSGTSPLGVALRPVTVSHLVASPTDSAALKRLVDIGNSDGCSQDVACQSAWTDTGRGVVKLLFTMPGGGSALCTGTLLNDSDTSTSLPYVLTAAHCINTQSSASSLNTYWFFERAACGGPAPASVTQTSGGAMLLSAVPGNDHSLLRLAAAAPGGATYAGWTANSPSAGTASTGVHHPGGDLKKISFGAIDSAAEYGGYGTTGDHYRVSWTDGVTEGGSSGSGLFLTSSRQLVGVLHGGASACSAPLEPDWYGRFDQAYRHLKPWLDSAFTSASAAFTIAAGVSAGDWQFFRITAAPGSLLSVEISGLAGDADLYLRAADFPSLTLWNCRPLGLGNQSESCAVTVPPSGIVHAGIYGYEASSLTFRTIGDTPAPPVAGDFDGDGDADVAVYRPSTSTWYVRNQLAAQFGQAGDIPVPGDYDGDGRSDLAIYRPSSSTWLVKDGVTLQFGEAGDLPVPGDYNGDGTMDVAVYQPSTGTWSVHGQFTVIYGSPGDRPVAADYDGDGALDVAVYRPSTGMWFVHDLFSVQFGERGDLPVPGDYDGDGTADLAVYRESNGFWYVRDVLAAQFGGPDYRPLPRDYDGDGTTDLAVFLQSTGVWYVKDQLAVQFGDPSDLPVPLGPPLIRAATAGDYDGDGDADVGVFRPATGAWYVRNILARHYGEPGDRPVPADYNGDGTIDVAVYRPATGYWYVRDQFSVQLGAAGDIPVPADYDGDGLIDIAVFRPSTGVWLLLNRAAVQWGASGDIPVPGDYNGDGTTDFAVYRPSTGMWYVSGVFTLQFGDASDIAAPGDYDGDGLMDVAVYRPATGTWYVRNLLALQFGDPGDRPVPGDFNGDGTTDIGVYRPSTGFWFVRNLLAAQFGDSGDQPLIGPGLRQ